ncbi:DUF3900 domain-containing protein [Cohnella nanjingensis]|uniref:DUF3900 domain-containing protein n=1 Tax=Cohnella nanjingensis TaxID=1387779 RepID=A0A7X0RLP9_9BACL|nr:DUF3900 domain-containing protein [Cohnella nanjingensis]MBB6669839.1 DUF3900 domain-containing protein [Cohnella nanjingensis]
MKFAIQNLSFFVIQTDGGKETDATRRYKHYKTLDHYDYEDSEIKSFLDEEFSRIGKRKADVHADSENAPTKIGRFIVEPGQDLESNPNYNLFQRLRAAGTKEQFHYACDDLLRAYMDTSAVRGGAFIVALGKMNELFDDPFVFVLKCDFESKIARISDEKSLISKVDMAISARNIKSIQYPHMPEEGMLEPWELKIHQASHARYFEDFLKYVSYEKSKPEILNEQVLGLVQEYMERKWQDPDAGASLAPAPAAPAYGEEPGGYADAGAGAYGSGGGYEDAPARLQSAYDVYEDGEPDGQAPAYETTRAERESAPGSQNYGYSPYSGGHPGYAQEARQLEVWAAGDKRQLQEKWTHDDVMEATARIVEHQPDLDLKFKIDDLAVRGKMTDYGDSVHIARMNGRYVVLIEGDSFQFEKGMSPVELLHPEDIEEVLARMRNRTARH